jgi:hypothetical protein
MTNDPSFASVPSPPPPGKSLSGSRFALIIAAMVLFGGLALKLFEANNKIHEQENRQREQRDKAFEIWKDQIRNTPPEKLGRATKILLGIEDENIPLRAEHNPDAPAPADEREQGSDVQRAGKVQ